MPIPALPAVLTILSGIARVLSNPMRSSDLSSFSAMAYSHQRALARQLNLSKTDIEHM
jgi:hypothetical protein